MRCYREKQSTCIILLKEKKLICTQAIIRNLFENEGGIACSKGSINNIYNKNAKNKDQEKEDLNKKSFY